MACTSRPWKLLAAACSLGASRPRVSGTLAGVGPPSPVTKSTSPMRTCVHTRPRSAQPVCLPLHSAAACCWVCNSNQVMQLLTAAVGGASLRGGGAPGPASCVQRCQSPAWLLGCWLLTRLGGPAGT